jgi:O-acetylserine/cysteine efflux transporter
MPIQHQAVAVLVSFIWGTNFVLVYYALKEFDSFTLAALRFLFVALPLVFFLPRPDVLWRYLIAYGLLIGVGQFGILFWALQENITPGLASLVVQLQVFFTVFLTLIMLNERVSTRQVLALIVCFSGLLIIFVYTDEATSILGIVLVLIAALSWACGNLVIKQVGKVDTFAFLAWSSLFSIPPLAMMAWYASGAEVIVLSLTHASWLGWSTVLWQSVGNTLIGYGLWNLLLHRYPAAIVTPWALLVPVFGMGASWLLIDEVMPWWKLLAMVLIVVGLGLNMGFKMIRGPQELTEK